MLRVTEYPGEARVQQKRTRKKKNLGGRPPLPKHKRRGRRSMVQLTESEFRRLRRCDPKKSTSDLVREAVLLYLERKES